MKLLRTGITGLDELLKGGLPPGLLLIAGEPGSASEVFAQQIAYSMAKHAPISYLTLNRSVGRVRQDMMVYGWDTTKLEGSDSWRFIRMAPDKLGSSFKSELQRNRSVVVDSLSDAIYGRDATEALDLLRSAAGQDDRGEMLHLCLITKGMHDSMVEVAAQHFADGVVDLTMNFGPESATRKMFIKKLGGSVSPVRNITYVVGQRGISIETALRIT